MVDIILPFYNRKNLILRAIQSVKNQTFQDWFLWLIDDGSTDGGLKDLKKELPEHAKILAFKENRGVSFARNQALKQGQRAWVAFLDSDDEWLPEKLEKQMDYLLKNPDKNFVHCNETWIKNKKILPQKKHHKKQGGRVFIPSTRLCCMSPSATLMKRSLFKELGLFREDFPVCEDYELWLRVSSRYEVGFLEETLIVKYGGHEGQLSEQYRAMDYWRVKALKPFLEDPHLSFEETQQVQKILIEKCQILLKGYEKHKNFTHQKEINDLLKQVVDKSLTELGHRS